MLKLHTDIIAQIDELPKTWQLIEIGANKNPLQPNWQKGVGDSHHLIKYKIKNTSGMSFFGRVLESPIRGIGLLTGDKSDGLLAIDFDGPESHAIGKAMGFDFDDTTVSWTSGKEGRRQVLYRVPKKHRDAFGCFTTIKLRGYNGLLISAKDQQLEIRYNRCQSVLPPSVHPTTGNYEWVNNQKDYKVKVLTEEQCKTLLEVINKRYDYEPDSNYISMEEMFSDSVVRGDIGPSQISALIEKMLSYITPDCSYDTWVKIGMALANFEEYIQENDMLYDECFDMFEVYKEWSRTGHKYPGDYAMEKKWASFQDDKNHVGRKVTLGSVVFFATQNGFKMPKSLSRLRFRPQSKQLNPETASGYKLQGRFKHLDKDKYDFIYDFMTPDYYQNFLIPYLTEEEFKEMLGTAALAGYNKDFPDGSDPIEKFLFVSELNNFHLIFTDTLPEVEKAIENKMYPVFMKHYNFDYFVIDTDKGDPPHYRVFYPHNFLRKLTKGFKRIHLRIDRYTPGQVDVDMNDIEHKIFLSIQQHRIKCKLYNMPIVSEARDFAVDFIHSVPFTSLIWQQNSQYLPQVDLPVNTPYMPDVVNIPYKHEPGAKPVVLIKGKHGTGKTQLIKQHIAKVKEVEDVPPVIIALTHRVSLCRDIANSFGVPYIKDLESVNQFLSTGAVLCIDSLLQKNNLDLKALTKAKVPIIVVIDEIEQGVRHLIHSKTDIMGHRHNTLEILRKLLNKASFRGQVIVADADLSVASISFLQRCMGRIAPPLHKKEQDEDLREHFLARCYFIHNEYKGKSYDVHMYDDSMEWDVKLEDCIRNQKRPIYIYTGSQKETSSRSTTVLELVLKTIFPSKRILRIDSETRQITDHPANMVFASGGNWSILKDFDIVIASRTIETGCSIPEDIEFDAVFSHTIGNVSPTDFLQGNIRPRCLCPRYVLINKRVNTVNRLGYSQQDVKISLLQQAALTDEIEKGALKRVRNHPDYKKKTKSKTRKGKKGTKKISRNYSNRKSIYQQLKHRCDQDPLEDIFDLENIDNILEQTFCQVIAIHNLANADYEYNIRFLFAHHGHRLIAKHDVENITEIKGLKKSTYQKWEKDAKDGLLKAKVNNIINSDPIGVSEAKDLNTAPSKTREQLYSLAAYDIREIYGDDMLIEEVVSEHLKGNLYSSLLTRALVTEKDLEMVLDNDRRVFCAAYSFGSPIYDRIEYYWSGKISILQNIGLRELIEDIDRTGYLDPSSDAYISLFDKWSDFSELVYKYFGVSYTSKEKVRTHRVIELLNIVGYRCKYDRKNKKYRVDSRISESTYEVLKKRWMKKDNPFEYHDLMIASLEEYDKDVTLYEYYTDRYERGIISQEEYDKQISNQYMLGCTVETYAQVWREQKELAISRIPDYLAEIMVNA